MVDLSALTLSQLLRSEGFDCDCGKHHDAPLRVLRIAPGALAELPACLAEASILHPYVVMDGHTREAAGNAATALLDAAGIPYTVCCLPGEPRLLPNEDFLALLRQDMVPECDFILGVGSGVINDLCKMLGLESGLRTGIVATAPSMDGYASNSSAMELSGVKTTVYNACPALILCDTEIMRHAPIDMLRSGFGDMAAKVLSIAEWRMARLVTGEYYCDNIARMMLSACQRVIDAADGVLAREEPAIRAMTEGLVLSGIAMSFAGVSRPASGVEHTISHLLEMFALARHARPAFHGIQVGYGVRVALRLYAEAIRHTPDAASCEAALSAFDEAAWEADMVRVFGAQANGLIRTALAEGRNSPDAVRARFTAAIAHWDEICALLQGVLDRAPQLVAGLDRMGIPAIDDPQSMGYTSQEAVDAFLHSQDLRSRYVFSSLCHDMGLMPILTKVLAESIRRPPAAKGFTFGN